MHGKRAHATTSSSEPPLIPHPPAQLNQARDEIKVVLGGVSDWFDEYLTSEPIGGNDEHGMPVEPELHKSMLLVHTPTPNDHDRSNRDTLWHADSKLYSCSLDSCPLHSAPILHQGPQPRVRLLAQDRRPSRPDQRKPSDRSNHGGVAAGGRRNLHHGTGTTAGVAAGTGTPRSPSPLPAPKEVRSNVM